MDELFVLTGKSELKEAVRVIHDIGVETIIVTMGAQGSLLSVEGVCYSVPACSPAVVVDPTGAGDVFIGAFLAEYLNGKDTLWCTSVGSAAASFVVEIIGSAYIGTKNQIYQRAQTIVGTEVK
jgi:sugar/nucleoside kinase (ribokinase family)